VDQLVGLLPLIGIALLFWLLIIRPQSRRQKALSRLQGGLAPGNQVMLSSGVYGVVEQVADDRVHLRIAEGVTIEVARGAVANVVQQPEEPTDGPTTETTPGT
jgi:preprotein translocase subunit YajC